jgi:hypothetical protein
MGKEESLFAANSTYTYMAKNEEQLTIYWTSAFNYVTRQNIYIFHK